MAPRSILLKVILSTLAFTTAGCGLVGWAKAVLESNCRCSLALHVQASRVRLLELTTGPVASRALFETFNQYLVPLIDQLNDARVVVGCVADVELGEISFRCVGREHGLSSGVDLAWRGLNALDIGSLGMAKAEAPHVCAGNAVGSNLYCHCNLQVEEPAIRQERRFFMACSHFQIRAGALFSRSHGASVPRPDGLPKRALFRRGVAVEALASAYTRAHDCHAPDLA